MKPQVKESEKNRVLSTTDYNLFVLPDFRVSRKFLNDIIESIGEKNLCKDYPVLVEDKTYRIIDGRYRFIASKGKRLPIYYKVAEVTTIYDAVRIKNLVKRSDYELVINTFSDLLEPYNDLKVLCDLFPEIPIQYIVRATKVACKAYKFRDNAERYESPCNGWERINTRLFQSGKLPSFSFDEVQSRLQTLSILYSYLSDKIKPERIRTEGYSYKDVNGNDFAVKHFKITWYDAFRICAHYEWGREQIDRERTFIITCQNLVHGRSKSFSDECIRLLESEQRPGAYWNKHTLETMRMNQITHKISRQHEPIKFSSPNVVMSE